jgi:hypothetical protein
MCCRTALAVFAWFGLFAPTRAADDLTVAGPCGRARFRLSKDAKSSLSYLQAL